MKKIRAKKVKEKPEIIVAERNGHLKVAVGVISFLVYGSTCYRSVPGGDSRKTSSLCHNSRFSIIVKPYSCSKLLLFNWAN